MDKRGSRRRILWHFFLLLAGSWTLCAADAARKPFAVALRNASFDEAVKPGARVPPGWNLYSGGGKNQSLRVVPRPDGGKALLLSDDDAGTELGLFQDLPVKPNLAYETAVDVAAVKGKPFPSNIYLQMRFLPANTLVQRRLATRTADAFRTLRLTGLAPAGTKTLRLYLYTHVGRTTHILLDNVRIRGGVAPPPPSRKAPVMKAPQYTALKKLCRETPLAAGGKARAAIVVPATTDRYGAAAKKIQAAVKSRCGVELPIVSAKDPEAAIPLTRHLVLLGNRSTNAAIATLYERYYTLLDLKYPGPGGWVVRSLHNPFGNGRNAIFAGGSDDAGVARAADELARIVKAAPARPGNLALGWLMKIKLGKGVRVPKDLRKFETWGASEGYGSVGYFGWNSLSKRMAMYYMTGDESQAAEFLRLAFPDKKAIEDIKEIDGERIENKDDPLAGAYHYNQHMMVLYWDLIEESPLFTDAQRLRVTNALARQLEHPDWARKGVFGLEGPAAAVGSRHGQWAAIGLYCLGRYFQTYYPSPVWEHCRAAGAWAFASLHDHAWVHGESDNLFWYSTGIAPIFTYLALSGDREPIENGVIATLLRGQEILFSGERGDRQIHYASLGFLNKAAAFTGDGRWIYYRERTRMNTKIFRLGQSWWPPPDLKPAPPLDLCGKWSVFGLPQPMWAHRHSGIPIDQSFQFASFRTDPGAGGDFMLLDGYNGASRNPYHTFAVLDLRIGGTTLLRGYLNQVLTKADGMVEATVAMDAALLDRAVLGRTAYAVGDVPRAAYCDWRRTLCQRVGQYALVLDDLTFRTDSRNMTVETLWETRGGRWRARRGAAVLAAVTDDVPAHWIRVGALDAACVAHPDTPGLLKPLDGLGIVLLRATRPGARLDLPFTLEKNTTGTWFLDTIRYRDRGVVRILLDGKEIARDLDLHAESAVKDRIPLGDRSVKKGRHTLTLEVTGRSPGVDRCYAAIEALVVRPAGTPKKTAPRQAFTLHPSLFTKGVGSGVVRVTWNGPVAKGGHRRFFTLFVRQPENAVTPACLPLGKTAAALLLPAPALAAVTGYEGVAADLLVAAGDHLFARNLTAAGPAGELLRVSAPASLDWNFFSGRLVAEAPTAVTLSLATATAAGLRLDGAAPASATTDGETLRLELTPGRHVLEGCTPAPAALARLRARLDALVKDGIQQHAAMIKDAKAGSRLPKAPPVSMREIAADLGPDIADMIRVGPDAAPRLAVAAGNTLRLMRPDGSTEHSVTTAGPIRVLAWWPGPGLVLAGCKDEKLYAVGLDGKVRWIFTSVMDPAVFRAAKTYWFKSAPGHEGIHGLAAGRFYDGKEQCFVGSACTLEVLDPAGKLVERRPVFWGPGKILRFLDRTDGSRDLLIARWPNGTDRIAVLKNTTRKLRYSFYGVPSGQSMVGGWSAQNRVDLIPADMNGDGAEEVVSATNGRWNRVTVFANNGSPRYNAQFGPGSTNRFRAVMRDLVVTDLDGDGRPEILTATAEGLVVALDNQCRRLWSRRLPAAPCLLAAPVRGRPDAAVLAGCDNGALVWLDPQGAVSRTGKVAGRPLRRVRLPGAAGRDRFAIVTNQGRLYLIEEPGSREE